MSKTTFIYALYNPSEPEHIRYIGKSDDPDKRLKQHIHDENSRVTTKSNWIKYCLSRNIKPSIMILEEVSYDHDLEWGDRECHYIAKYRLNGHMLSNTSEGGPSFDDTFKYEDLIQLRKDIYLKNPTQWNKIKLEETELIYATKKIGLIDKWHKLDHFYSNYDCVDFQYARLKLHDMTIMWLLLKSDGSVCSQCGVLIESSLWPEIMGQFDFVIPKPPACETLADKFNHTKCDNPKCSNSGKKGYSQLHFDRGVMGMSDYYDKFTNGLPYSDTRKTFPDNNISFSVVEFVKPILSAEKCEWCGLPMLVKEIRSGKYLGCSGHPICKNIQPLVKPKNTGIVCPECKEGELIRKQMHSGTVYYSCNKYPNCKYTLQDLCMESTCPKCNFPLLVKKIDKHKGEQLKCPTQNCDYTSEFSQNSPVRLA